jgi:hypothetical protein
MTAKIKFITPSEFVEGVKFDDCTPQPEDVDCGKQSKPSAKKTQDILNSIGSSLKD